jgi:tetratricopeptide (TPR) repeat protein
MTECPAREQLVRLLAEQLGGAEAGRVEAHVQGCARCQETLENLCNGGPTAPGAPAAGPEPRAEFLRRLREARPDPDDRPGPADGAAATAPPPGSLAAGGTTEGWPAVPGYELLGELGRGGMGVVFKARHLALKRLVALKMVLAGGFAGPAELARFRTEAEAVARLQHPNIIQIHEVGDLRSGGTTVTPFLSLEFVEGGNLAVRLAGGALPADQAAQMTETLGRAMQHAHQKGVVHRDLKPANVLLTADGQPKVTDFGLAKQTEGSTGRTASGAVLGTPPYMAPEQAAGQGKGVGPAADVYALGAILYECLTGRPPFRAATPLDTLLQVLEKEPVPPSKVNPRVPRDLETICLKCLAKEPARRYQSALALAQDLERYRAGESILARREGLPARLWRKVKRRPLLAALAPAVAAALVVAALLGRRAWNDHEAAARERAATARDRQITALSQQIEGGLDAADWTADNLGRLDERIADLRALAPEQAGGARQRLARRFAADVRRELEQDQLAPADVSRIREQLALLADRDAGAGAELRQTFERRLHVWEPLFDLSAPFAGAGQVFEAHQATAGQDALVLKSSATAGQARDRPFTFPTRVPSDGSVRLEAVFDSGWDTSPEAGLLLNTRLGHTTPVVSVGFAPDGRTLASGGAARGPQPGELKLWDPDSGRLLRTRVGPANEGGAAVFTPDGRTVAVVMGAEGYVALLDADTLQEKGKLSCDGSASVLGASRDGRVLAAGGQKDGTPWVRLWEMPAGRAAGDLAGLAGLVRCLALSPDGRLLATAHDKKVQLWDLSSRQEKTSWDTGGVATGLAFSPDSKLLAIADGGLKLWDVASRKERPGVPVAHPVRQVAFSPDGGHLALGGDRVSLWDLDTGQRRWQTPGRLNVVALAFSADGRRLAAACDEAPGTPSAAVTVWEVDSERKRELGDQRYAFLLQAVPFGRPGEVPKTLTLAEVRQEGGVARLQILRNGTSLRQQEVKVPAGRWRLRVSREGDQLTLRLNDEPPLECQDLFPLAGGDPGVFAVRAPAETRLLRLRAEHQARPLQPSPLERGDDLFNRGQLAEALAVYQERAAAVPRDPAVRYKLGQCLAALDRPEEALRVFEPLAIDPDERWALLATCQLWLLQLRLQRVDEADHTFESVLTRFRLDDIVRQVPDDLRASLLAATAVMGRLNYTGYEPDLVRRSQRAVAVADTLQAGVWERIWRREWLARAYWRFGDTAAALKTHEELSQLAGGGTVRPASRLMIPADYYWLLRDVGKPGQALQELDAALYETPGVYRKTLAAQVLFSLILERARIHYALKEWDAAEKDLAEFFRVFEGVPLDQRNYRMDYARDYPSACLMAGFLRDQRGDAAGALAVWKKGCARVWLGQMPAAHRERFLTARRTTPEPCLEPLILAAVAGELDDEEFQATIGGLQAALAPDSPLSRLIGVFPLRASTLVNAAKPARARELLRRYAFLQISFAEYHRVPVIPLLAEFLREGTVPGRLSADQEDLFWDLSVALAEAYAEGKVTTANGFQLLLAWKGTANLLGWGGVAPALSPEVRGPLAYVVGLRYRHVLNQRDDGARLFRTAVADAPPDSPLRRLAQAELDTLPKK